MLFVSALVSVTLVFVAGESNSEPRKSWTAFGTYVDTDGNISLPENFVKTWVHMGTWAVVEEDLIPDMHSVYAPIQVIEHYREHGDFADGAMLIKEVRHARGADHTTGRAFWATDEVIEWFVMVKDTQNRFPDNSIWGHGWGWGLFKGDDQSTQVSDDYTTDCLGCHVPAEHLDYSYVYAYPVLGKDVVKHEPEDVYDTNAIEETNIEPATDHRLVERGERVFKRCKACHSLDADKHKSGPSLAGIIGRKAGSASGYSYSEAMQNSDVVWNAETLNAHLKDVRNFIPGNLMGKVYPAGVSKEDDRLALIEYLKTK